MCIICAKVISVLTSICRYLYTLDRGDYDQTEDTYYLGF